MAKYVGPLGNETEEIDRPYSTFVDRMLDQQKRQERWEAAVLISKNPNQNWNTNPSKENIVSTVDTQIKTELRKRRDEREIAKRLALVDAFGEDPFDAGTVLTFEKKFESTKDKPYTYAAIKAPEGDIWFTTGHDCVMGATFTWDGLIEFLVTGPYPAATVTVKAEGGDAYPSTGNVYPTTEGKDK